MRYLLRIEEALMAILAYYLFQQLDYHWWVFAALFLAPDIGMIGYLINSKVGAWTYNLLHHKGVAVALYLIGAYYHVGELQLAGCIMLAHASFDRVLGYGLKYNDAFKHTHLGTIGRA